MGWFDTWTRQLFPVAAEAEDAAGAANDLRRFGKTTDPSKLAPPGMAVESTDATGTDYVGPDGQRVIQLPPTLVAGNPGVSQGELAREALSRTRGIDDASREGRARTIGFLNPLTVSDELAGAEAFVGHLLPGGESPVDAYIRVRDQIRAAEAEAERSYPGEVSAGRLAGNLALAPVLPVAEAAEASTALGRIAAGTYAAGKTGTAYGALQSWGASQAEPGDSTLESLGRQAFDTTLGAVGGGLVGSGFGLGTGLTREIARGLREGGPAMAQELRELSVGQRVRGLGGRMPQARDVRQNFPGGLEGFNQELERLGIRDIQNPAQAREWVDGLDDQARAQIAEIVAQARQRSGPNAGVVSAEDIRAQVPELFSRLSPGELARIETQAAISPRQRAVMQGTMEVVPRPVPPSSGVRDMQATAAPRRVTAPVEAPPSEVTPSDFMFRATGRPAQFEPMRDPRAMRVPRPAVMEAQMGSLSPRAPSPPVGTQPVQEPGQSILGDIARDYPQVYPEQYPDVRRMINEWARFRPRQTTAPLPSDQQAGRSVYSAFNRAADERLATDAGPAAAEAMQQARRTQATLAQIDKMLGRGEEAATNQAIGLGGNIQAGAQAAAGRGPLAWGAAALADRYLNSRGPFVIGNAASNLAQRVESIPARPGLAALEHVGADAPRNTLNLIQAYRALARGGRPATAMAQPSPNTDQEAPMATEADFEPLPPMATEDDFRPLENER